MLAGLKAQPCGPSGSVSGAFGGGDSQNRRRSKAYVGSSTRLAAPSAPRQSTSMPGDKPLRDSASGSPVPGGPCGRADIAENGAAAGSPALFDRGDQAAAGSDFEEAGAAGRVHASATLSANRTASRTCRFQ